jgi:alkanesulfonate monooxygenase SsuD/methylene tetrahydromethanopterin reductase-like flavin-dependent oxidoreductase (luciferase family)
MALRIQFIAAAAGLFFAMAIAAPAGALDPERVAARVVVFEGNRADAGEKPIMKVGLFINTQFREGFNLTECVPEMVAQVRAARDAGFASLWFPHHWLTHPMQMLQITPVMGYVAAHAQGMTIGPNILILPPLNPVHVAEEAATLDVLTSGNYILGIGLGYRQPEFDAFGISLTERAPRFNEAIGLMRRLWTEERVSHQGRFYTINDAGIGVKPVRRGGPPLYIAAQADVSVRRAARIGDAWLIVNSSGLGKGAPLMQTYRAALKEYGRTPMEYPITVECYVGARHATAHDECRGPLEYKYNTYASWGLEDRTSVSFEDFARNRFIIGDKTSVKDEIARYRELLGVDHFIMRCQWPGLPQKQVLGSIRRLGEIFAL